MNKYQEALHKLVKHIDFPNSPQRAFDSSKDEPRKYYIALQELVDKATPKKVDKNTKGVFPNNDTYLSYHTTYACPNCNCKLHLDWHEKRNYCPHCGQALDWSDE